MAVKINDKDREIIIKSLITEVEVAKGIMKDLIDNAPNHYAGNDVELNQKRMLRFQNAISNAKTFIKD